MRGQLGHVNSLRCGGRQGTLRSRRQLRGAPLTAFLAAAREVVKELKLL